MKHRICAAILAASAALGLSACTTDGYGYGGLSMGYGSGYYGDPYWGWYDNYYYPGSGYYIYDRGGTRHRWNDGQRAYWEGRRGNRQGRENWSGYRNRDGAGNPALQQQRREAWRQQQGTGASDPARAARREAWRAQRQQQGATAQPQRSERGGGWWNGGRGGRDRRN